MPSKLSAITVNSLRIAHTVSGEDNSSIVLYPSRGFLPFISIPEGFYALVTSNGAEIPHSNGSYIWPSGFYWASPFTKVAQLVTKNAIVFDAPVKNCKTKDNVSVHIDVALTFRIMGDASKGEDPELLRTFVHQVSPSGLTKMLNASQEEAIRALASSINHTEVYGLRSEAKDLVFAVIPGTNERNRYLSKLDADEKKSHDEGKFDQTLYGEHDESAAVLAFHSTSKGSSVTAAMLESFNNQFNRLGIQFLDVFVTDVRLPHNIEDQMSNKTMVISENAQQKKQLEFSMQTQTYQQEIMTLQQSYEEQRSLEEVNGQKEIIKLKAELESLKALTSKQVSEIVKLNQIAIEKVNADSSLEVMKLKVSADEVSSQLRATASKESEIMIASAEKYSQEKLAEAELDVAKNDAKGKRMQIETEGAVAPMLRQTNEYTTKLKKMEVGMALSSNPDLLVVPQGSPALDRLMLCDAVLSKSDIDANVPRHELLSEFTMLMRASKGLAVPINY